LLETDKTQCSSTTISNVLYILILLVVFGKSGQKYYKKYTSQIKIML